VSARFVPHLLTPDQNHQHTASSVEFVEMIDDDSNVLKRTVTSDESWCFRYDPETKCQSATWLSPTILKARKVRMQKSRVRTMLTAFFDAKDIIHLGFVPEKLTVNGKSHKEVIRRLIARVHSITPKFQESRSWYLLHDNALVHSLAVVNEFMAKRGMPCYPIHPIPLNKNFLFPLKHLWGPLLIAEYESLKIYSELLGFLTENVVNYLNSENIPYIEMQVSFFSQLLLLGTFSSDKYLATYMQKSL
jgi:hypothetical protein